MKQNIDSNKINLAVLFGGRTVEHEISIISALQLVKALDDRKYNLVPVYIAPDGKWYTGLKLLDKSIYKKFNSYLKDLTPVTLLPEPRKPGLRVLDEKNKYINVDVYFPVFHGEFGEDGCIQGLFEMAGVNYVGFNVPAAAVSMNKNICKLTLSAVGIPVLPGTVIQKFDFLNDSEQAIKDLKDFPLFVKPCNRGSSIGIAKVENEQELQKALLNVFRFDLQAIIEPFLSEMFEINIAVLNSGSTRTSVVEIPHSDSGVLSYEDKYMRQGSKKSGESQGMASLTRAINPQDLDPDIKKTVKDYALLAYKTLECVGNSRFDFMCDKKTGKIYLNEINPMPGSLAFYLWVESDPQLLYTDLIDELVQSAIHLGKQKASVERFVGYKAL